MVQDFSQQQYHLNILVIFCWDGTLFLLRSFVAGWWNSNRVMMNEDLVSNRWHDTLVFIVLLCRIFAPQQKDGIWKDRSFLLDPSWDNHNEDYEFELNLKFADHRLASLVAPRQLKQESIRYEGAFLYEEKIQQSHWERMTWGAPRKHPSNNRTTPKDVGFTNLLDGWAKGTGSPIFCRWPVFNGYSWIF